MLKKKKKTLLIAYRPEGREDLLQHLQQSLLPTGGDVVLGHLQEGKAVLALAPHVLRKTDISEVCLRLLSHFFY